MWRIFYILVQPSLDGRDGRVLVDRCPGMVHVVHFISFMSYQPKLPKGKVRNTNMTGRFQCRGHFALDTDHHHPRIFSLRTSPFDPFNRLFGSSLISLGLSSERPTNFHPISATKCLFCLLLQVKTKTPKSHLENSNCF